MKQQQRIALIALVAVVVVLGAWYAAFWRPETSHLKAAQSNQAQAAAQLTADQAQLAQLQAERPKLAAEKKTLARLVQAVPNGPSLDQLLRTISTAAHSAGVFVTAVSTPQPTGWGASASSVGATPGSASAPTAGPAATGSTATGAASTSAASTSSGTAASAAAPAAQGPGAVQVTVNVTGLNAHILNFITALDAQPRIYVVDSFGLQAPSTSGSSVNSPSLLSTGIVLQAFYESAGSGNPTFPG